MQLALFGGLRLMNHAGAAVEISSRKAKALLAWLALHQDQAQPRERLAALLWEESDEAQARHSLRQALSTLRKALGAQARTLDADQERILLRGGSLEVDALQFDALLAAEATHDALAQAVSLYQGELLEGFSPRSEGYEQWLMTLRSHYRERAIGAMSALLRQELETGEPESGVRLAIRLLGADPLREEGHRILMRLYDRLKRPAEALRQYRRCRRILSRELGVNPEPETERLYRAIAKGRSNPGRPTDPAQSPVEVRRAATAVHDEPQDSVEPPATPDKAGRPRLRTAAVAHLGCESFLDVAGSDPEGLHLRAEELAGHVERLALRYRGRLHYRHNGKFLVLFGLSAASGNECERAAQMAMALKHEIGASDGTKSGAPAIRAAIACGTLVYADESSVIGTPLTEAERLAGSAAPGQVILSETAYRAIRCPTDAQLRDDSAWILHSLGGAWTPATRPGPFVGRHRELRQIGAILEAAIEDQAGETILLRGEAGIGKTRLIEEVTARAESLGAACHRSLVLDFGMEARSEPIPSLLRQLLEIPEEASPAQVQEQVRERLETGWNEGPYPPILYALLGLAPAETPDASLEALSDEARRRAAGELLDQILERTCDERPRLLIVEDIHWADPPTLDLLADLAAAVGRRAALLIITSRIEGEPLDPAWRSAMHGAPLTTLDLAALRPEESLQLAAHTSRGDRAFIERCIKRSGGNPFFLEQLLWGAEAGVLEIPDSVQSLVLTRLDLLESADQETARAASVLGQRFSLEALKHLLCRNDLSVDALLKQRLIQPAERAFLFRHALIRDGIYASLLTSERHRLHLQAADWYREKDPALYARHLDLGADPQAAEAYLRAARLAISTLHFDQALELASRGVEISRDPELSGRIQNLRGELLVQAGTIEAAESAYGSAAQTARDPATRSRALIGRAAALTVRDDLDGAFEALSRAEPLAAASGDPALQTELHYRRGDILFALGRVTECLDAHRKAESLARESKAPLLEIRALAGLADAHYALGRMKTAERYFERCIDLAKREKRLPQELGNLSMRGLTRFYTGSMEAALADQKEAARLAAQYGNLRAEMTAYVNLALILLYTDDMDGAEQAARLGLELTERLGATRFLGDNLASIGEALARKGCLEEGIDFLERAYRAAQDSVPTHTGPFILGVLARLTPDEKRRSEAIAEGQRLLDQGGLSHNYLHFYQNLIEVSLNAADPKGARRYAAALEAYTSAEPLAWSDFYIARGRLLADTLGRGIREGDEERARQLLQDARAAGLWVGTAELEGLAGAGGRYSDSK